MLTTQQAHPFANNVRAVAAPAMALQAINALDAVPVYYSNSPAVSLNALPVHNLLTNNAKTAQLL